MGISNATITAVSSERLTIAIIYPDVADLSHSLLPIFVAKFEAFRCSGFRLRAMRLTDEHHGAFKATAARTREQLCGIERSGFALGVFLLILPFPSN